MADPEGGGRPASILVVDDTTANLQLLTELLGGHGYAVHPASDGELALEYVRAELPDLVMLDIRMPGMDGYEVCRRLKADPLTRAIPVIFISVLEDEHAKVEAFRRGAVDYVTKPFQAEEVLARIRIHLRVRELTERLEQKVGERTTELSVANRRLQQEIAERRQAEEQVRRLNLELEARVRDRTADLEAANRELEAFAYSVSHDLRAPLRHIAGFIGLLQRHAEAQLDEKGRHYTETIARAAESLAAMIDHLLAFSRLGRADMKTSQVDLAALVEDVVRSLAPEAEGRTVAWRIGRLPAVSADGRMLRLALTNLVSNALKFTRREPRAEIEIGCAERPAAAGAEAVVFVRDNGVGFDDRYADKLFKVFQRLHRPEDFEGTGIGLASVRRIVERHGGRVWAEGAPGRGATFYFSLPAPLAPPP